MGEREGHIAFLRSLKQGSEGIAIYQDTVDAVLAEVDDLNAEVARLRRGERPSSEFSAAEITLARAEGRLRVDDDRLGWITPRPVSVTVENTPENNARHIELHGRAKSKLLAAYAAYQKWQDDTGDWGTFVSWIKDEEELCAPGAHGPVRHCIAYGDTTKTLCGSTSAYRTIQDDRVTCPTCCGMMPTKVEPTT